MVASRAPNPRKSIKVGATVDVEMGTYIAQARVLEDRGLLGRDGERVWRVEVDLGGGDPTSFEIPESSIKRVR